MNDTKKELDLMAAHIHKVTNGAQQAFPCNLQFQSVFSHGMSLRDWFAGMAMSNGYTEISSAQEIAAWSYQIADAMIEAREEDSHD
jgi:hypothetical protein